MKVCVLNEYFYPDSTGGTGTVLSGLVRHLRDHYGDLEIDVVTSHNLLRGETKTLPGCEDWDGVCISRLHTPQPRKNSVRRRLATNALFTGAVLRHMLTRRTRYDLVLVATAPPPLALAARTYGRLMGTPYIYLVYDLFPDLAIATKKVKATAKPVRWIKARQKEWLGAASKVIVLGRCMKDRIAQDYQIPNERIAVVPIHSNINVIRPQSKETGFRARHGLNGFIVLYAGNFAQYQDFDTILDAAKVLKESSDITFVFVGDGAKKQDILARIERENLTNVRRFPFVDESELSDLLASADVSLVTLEEDVVGLAVPSKFYNILASGRPTVALLNASSEVALVVTEEKCGVQVNPGDSTGLARVIQDLQLSPHQTEEMGARARQVCEKNYTLENVGHQFYTLFEEVVSPHDIQPDVTAQINQAKALKEEDLRGKTISANKENGIATIEPKDWREWRAGI